MKERDEELERRFAEMRAGDRRRVPSFDAVLSRPRRRPFRAPLLAAVALVGMVAVAGVLMLPRLRGGPREGVGIAEWQSPTASLLVVPGSDLWRNVPSISESVIHLEAQ
jgi:hypothetical protein